jgi:hypothetical protein
MFRRLPTFKSLSPAAAVGLFALSSVMLAQPPAAVTGTGTGTSTKPDEIKRSQEENLKLFKRFAEETLRLAQRWEKSDNPDDRDRAKSLRAALVLIEKHGVEKLFKDLVEGLNNPNPNSGQLANLGLKDAKLLAALREILLTLDTEDEAERIKREIKELKELIKEVERIKREQENLRARTENPKGDPNKIAGEQGNLAKQTQDVADKVGGKDNKGNPNAGTPGGKDDKSEPKPETKPGDSSPEAKPDTPGNKADTKSGDSAGNPMGDPKPGGDPKASPMDGMSPGDSKEPPKEGANAGDPKPSGEPKPPMGGNPSDQKPMAGDPKAQGDGKADQKPSAGQQGGDSKPMTQQGGMPSGGQPSASKPSGGQPSGSPPSGGQPSGGQPKPNDQAQENIQQAVPQQQGAEQDIRKNEREPAGKKQDEAIAALERAIKELEKRLKQLREKELAKLLANLEERVNRMLRMQIEVREATISIDRSVKKNNNQKSNADIQKSQSEADKELTIIAEAEKALKLMEAEATAVVFAGVLNQVKGDMESVQKRLNEGRVEQQTQDIEQDIIDQLTMMKEALKKAKQDLENSQNKPPGDPSNNKPNQKLIDLLNELKLIKSLQEQVNKRTIGYSKQDPGEQAKDALVQAELKQLSERQKVLQEMLHKIATQANQ